MPRVAAYHPAEKQSWVYTAARALGGREVTVKTPHPVVHTIGSESIGLAPLSAPEGPQARLQFIQTCVPVPTFRHLTPASTARSFGHPSAFVAPRRFAGKAWRGERILGHSSDRCSVLASLWHRMFVIRYARSLYMTPGRSVARAVAALKRSQAPHTVAYPVTSTGRASGVCEARSQHEPPVSPPHPHQHHRMCCCAGCASPIRADEGGSSPCRWSPWW
jgi:hypothetical protein